MVQIHAKTIASNYYCIQNLPASTYFINLFLNVLISILTTRIQLSRLHTHRLIFHAKSVSRENFLAKQP